MIENEMVKLKKWFNDNKLSLNLNKTKFMIFGHQRREANILLSLDGVFIDRVSEFRFLGVIIDDKLTWKAHIVQVKSKVSKKRAVRLIHNVGYREHTNRLFIEFIEY